ncbi:aromatic acid exporter family protein [Clostridium sp. CS001]|uniref:FUSC family protein n=1 Tax=Clostridium sp. CS001 TaxID=2880648 RepID=UPI001CF216E9|nr:aromatic acid exporter family protein [Clostridium sp. CS001]MCB2288265.1 aromatic acid exporter family protein [Clostridium sp. CS001]
MQKIGMRNIKTAISVFLCMLILKLFKNTSPFYACIAAVITMQGTVHGSFTAGKNRLIGTIIGATFGLIFALISPVNILLTSIGIIFIIYFLSFADKKDSISIACVVFLAIMINVNQGNALIYSFKRVVETFIGITVAVFVNYLIFPPKYLDKLQQHSKTLTYNIFVISKEMFNFNTDINISIITKQITKLQKSLDSYSSEIRGGVTKDQHMLKINKLIETSKIACCHLIILNSLILSSTDSNCHLNKNNCIRINELLTENIIFCDNISNNPNIVFNFHVESLLELLTTLQKENPPLI